MAVDAVQPAEPGLVGRMSAWVRNAPVFYRGVVAELRRVTWPERDDVRKLAVLVIVLSLSVGGVIALIDFILQQVLVRWIPQIFAGR